VSEDITEKLKQVKEKFYRTIVVIEKIFHCDEGGFVNIRIPSRSGEKLQTFELESLPREISMRDLSHPTYYFAQVNLGVEHDQDLVFKDFDLAPLIEDEDDPFNLPNYPDNIHLKKSDS